MADSVSLVPPAAPIVTSYKLSPGASSTPGPAPTSAEPTKPGSPPDAFGPAVVTHVPHMSNEAAETARASTPSLPGYDALGQATERGQLP
jgi:hypothetical protein